MRDLSAEMSAIQLVLKTLLPRTRQKSFGEVRQTEICCTYLSNFSQAQKRNLYFAAVLQSQDCHTLKVPNSFFFASEVSVSCFEWPVLHELLALQLPIIQR